MDFTENVMGYIHKLEKEKGHKFAAIVLAGSKLIYLAAFLKNKKFDLPEIVLMSADAAVETSMETIVYLADMQDRRDEIREEIEKVVVVAAAQAMSIRQADSVIKTARERPRPSVQ